MYRRHYYITKLKFGTVSITSSNCLHLFDPIARKFNAPNARNSAVKQLSMDHYALTIPETFLVSSTMKKNINNLLLIINSGFLQSRMILLSY